MKKTLLVAAASLFVIGQAIAQNQPSGQQSNPPNAAQSEQTQKAPGTAKSSAKSSARSSHLVKVGRHEGMQRSAHRMMRHPRAHYAARRMEPNQQSGFGPQPGWNQQQGWNQQNWNRQQQQGWNQQGWNWNQHQSAERQPRRTKRMSSQEPQTTGFGGWNQSGPCKNGKRPDGSWC